MQSILIFLTFFNLFLYICHLNMFFNKYTSMKKILLLVVLSIVGFSCSESDKSGINDPGTDLEIQTVSAFNITFTSATSGGVITSFGDSPITAAGVCWSTSQNPTVASMHTSDSAATGNFSSAITPLIANVTYYVRAYATNSDGTVYGNQITFSTLNVLFTAGTGVTDVDSEFYPSVIIDGKQWMKKNLNVSKYKNGDVIPEVTDPAIWDTLTTGAWCYYENDTANGPVIGKLYNWYAINDPRGLAPAGWHIPTDAEWTTLTTFLGGENVAGKKIKESGTTNWATSNSYASNQSGFTALPSGHGYFNYNFVLNSTPALTDLFKYKTNVAYWWSATDNQNLAWTRDVTYQSDAVIRSQVLKKSGLSVRCVKN
jgi:uncharacterized protein (TIGR02145 family)